MKKDTKADISQRELDELRSEVEYLRRLSEQTVARMLRLDTDSIRIRHELEQKRRGFRLMAELSGIQGKHIDDENLFFSVSRRLNAALGMQRTVILVPENGGLFRPAVLQGYPAEEETAIAERRVALSQEFLDPKTPSWSPAMTRPSASFSSGKRSPCPFSSPRPSIFKTSLKLCW